MAQSVGILRIWWKGVKYDCTKGSSIRLPAYQNVAQVAGDTGHRSQQFQMGEVKATPMLLKGQSLADFNPDTEGELQVQADTGQTWTLPDAFILSAPTLTDDGGKMPVTWNCSTYTEILK